MMKNKFSYQFFGGYGRHYAYNPVVTQMGFPINQCSFTLRAAKHDPSAVIEKLSDHTIFTRAYEVILHNSGKRMLVPWTKKSSNSSEIMHITTFNAAMQSKKRGPGKFDFNTGLNIEESLQEYEARTEQNGYMFGLAAQHSAIGNVQEGTIHPNGLARFKKGLERACPGTFQIEDVTTWGLLTISNRRLLPQGLIKKTQSPFKGKMNDLDERIVTFKIPGYLTPFTTLHFPHGDPQQALTLYAANKKENIFRGIEKGHTTITQVASGDFNRRPELIEEAIRSEIENVFPADLGVKTKCKILYNESGHRRTTGEDITVDASVSLTVEFRPNQLERAKYIVASYREEQILSEPSVVKSMR